MRRINVGLIGLTGCLAFLLVGQVDAQGRGGRRGGGMLRMMLPIEQTIGYLAFDEKMALRDDQLVEIRGALKGVHAKRAALTEEMRGGGDRQAMMGQVQALRKEMIEGLNGVLDDQQDKLLDDYLKRIQEARQRFQQGGGRQGGGAGGAM